MKHNKAPNNIKVSVVIPCFNHGSFIEEAIASVLESKFLDYEIIIVNDGSTDTFTLKVFKKIEENFKNNSRIRIIHQDNLGLADARNNAIRAAKGEYILPLDADDKIRPNYLSKASEILDNNPDVGVVYVYAKIFGDRDEVWEFPIFNPQKLLLENFVAACSVFRKKVWQDCNGYDPNMVMGYEDWDLWLGAMENGWKFHLIKEVLFDYRVQENSMSSACNIPENRRVLIKFICNKHKNTYIENLDYVISEKDVAILEAKYHARDIIRHLEDVIREKDVHLRHLEDVIKERDANLDNIYNSRGWKLLLICYKLRDWIFPLNSMRKRLAKTIFKTIKNSKDFLFKKN